MWQALLVADVILTAAVFALTAYNAHDMGKHRREAAAEAAVDAAMDEQYKRSSIDEGFENIMAYSVNGRTGFEPDAEV